MTNRIVFLDGWRALAVLSVLVGHFVGIPGINLGRMGVELFFVLSGRLMAELLFVRRIALRDFFPRRFSRVYPALLVFALVMLATATLRGGDPTRREFLAAVTLTINYAQFFVGRSDVLDHIWSLCIEEHMYLLLGAITLLHRRFALPVVGVVVALAAIAAGIGIIQTLQGLDYVAVYWRTDVRGASLLFGVLAFLVLRGPVRGMVSWSWAPVLAGVAGVLLNLDVVPDPVKYTLGTGCFALSLVLLGQAPGFVLRVLEHPLLTRVGIWSYSLYLWQQPFYKLGGTLPARAIHLGIAVAVALVSFYGVEQPARRALNAIRWRKI